MIAGHSASNDELDALFAQAAAAETAGDLGRSLGLLARAMVSVEARGRSYQYLHEWRARLESALGDHVRAEASLVIARGLAEDAGSRHGVFRMDVARAEAAIAAVDLVRAEDLLGALRGDGPVLGHATADRCDAVLRWLRELRFSEHPAPSVALARVEAALTLVALWAERGKYRSALRLIAAIERDLPAAEIAVRVEQVRLLEIELLLEAGELQTAHARLAGLAPAPDAIDRTRVALIRARLALTAGNIADAVACLDDLALTPADDPPLSASAAAARIAILAELNLWQTADTVATRAIAALGTRSEVQPLIELLVRARAAASARGRSVLAVWEMAVASPAVQAETSHADAAGTLSLFDVGAPDQTRFTARWTRHANEVMAALERLDLAAAAQHQAALEAAGDGVESGYIAARIRMSAALVAYCTGPDAAAAEALRSIADDLHAIGARGAEAQAARYAAWAAAKLGRIDEYAELARRASSIIEQIASKLPSERRAQYLLNKWNGRDEFVAGRMRELLDGPPGGPPPHRRELCRVFREIELLTHWPVDHAFGERDATKLLHETSDVHARWVHELLRAPSPATSRGFQLRSPLSLWRLPARTLILHYHVLPDRTYLFRMTRGHIDVRVLQIGRLHLRFDMRRAAEDPEQLAWLAHHTGVAEAIKDFHGIRRAVIVPHDAIANVPFAALPVGGQPLCASVALSQVDRLDRLRRQQLVRRSGRGVGIGLASYGESEATDLPFAECEARVIATLMNGDTVIGDDATCSAVIGALRGATRVHVAAHGVFDPIDPAQSGLLLRDQAGYRTLTLHELRRIPEVRASLVTLATCRSAKSAVVPGGARICVPTALLDAGARGVIAALWPVDDAPSVEVMATLYGRLRKERASVALARTQAQLKSRPPHHWAGLVFYGND